MLKDMKTKIGCSTLTYRELDLYSAIDRIQDNGFNVIDIAIIPPDFCPHFDPVNSTDKDVEKLILDIHRRRMRVSSLNIVPGYLNMGNIEYQIDFIKKSIIIGMKLGVSTVTIPSGKSVDRSKWADNVKKVVEHIYRLADFAERYHIQLSIEAPHFGTLAETCDETYEFFKLLNDNRVKCTFDTSHVLRGEKYSLAEGISLIGADINHVHLRDAIGGDIQVTPGKGNCDFADFFKAMENIAYSGDFILELEYSKITPHKKQKELIFARDYLYYVTEDKEIPYSMALHKYPLVRAVFRIKSSLSNPREIIRKHPFLKAIAVKLLRFIDDITPKSYYSVGWRKKLPISEYLFSNLKIRTHPRENYYSKGKIIKAGILGCGWTGKEMHGPTYAKLRNVKLVGVCDIDKDKARAAAKKLSCNAYFSLEDLVNDAKPDLVSNCTKEWQHHQTTIDLINAGVDVFCEKIMAENYEDGLEMVKTAKRKDRVLAVNYNYRFIPGFRKIKEIINSGELGELILLHFFCHSYCYHHAIDLVQFLGGKVKKVFANYKGHSELKNVLRDEKKSYADDILYIPSIYSSVFFELTGGSTAVIIASRFFDYRRFLISLDAVFRKGCISLSEITLSNVIGRITSSVPIRNTNLDISKGVWPKDFAFSFRNSIKSFLNVYSSGGNAETSGEHALQIMRIEKAISESNKSDKAITL